MKYIGDEIYQIIPNRYPLMILDTLEIAEGIEAIGYKTLTDKEWFFECHYPGNPIMPGCLTIETAIQVFSSTFLSIEETDEIPVIFQIGGKDLPLMLYSSATVHDKLRFEAKLLSYKRGVAKGRCIVYKEIGIEKVKVTEFDVIETLPSKMVVPR